MVVLALISGRSAETYLDTQQAAHMRRKREFTDVKSTRDLVDSLVAHHGLFHLETDLQWIDLTAARLDKLASALW